MTINSILPNFEIIHALYVDVRALYYTITKTHYPCKFRLRKTVVHMRYAFKSGDLYCVSWIYGKSNFSDSLTMVNHELSGRLNDNLSCGIWDARLSV